MTSPTSVSGLAELSGRYDVLLCDVWGVIHNGRRSFPDAVQALVRWRAEVGPVILITNAPRPHGPVLRQLDSLAVPREAWSAVVTSGDATRALLAEHAPGPVWAIGTDNDLPLYEGLGLAFGGLEDSTFLCVTGPYDDEAETAEDYRERLAAAAARGLPMICANPDRVVHRGAKLVVCGGALADLYEALGGAVTMAGKPYGPIYDLCLDKAAELAGKPVDRSRVLCVGDGLPTDIKGANAQDLDVLFVAGGIHGAELIGPDGLNPEATERLLAEQGLAAAFAIDALRW